MNQVTSWMLSQAGIETNDKKRLVILLAGYYLLVH